MTPDDLYARALELHDELRAIRNVAKKLPLDDIRRWKLSIRADQITMDLKALNANIQGEKT